jgi:hypothetical protein
VALGVPVADLLPTGPEVDDLAVTRRQARKLFDELLESEDRSVLLLLTEVMVRLFKQFFYNIEVDHPI